MCFILGNLGAGPGKERSPGAAQGRERRAGPKEGSPKRERNPGAGPGSPGAILERERSPGAAQEREQRLKFTNCLLNFFSKGECVKGQRTVFNLATGVRLGSVLT